MLGIMLAACGLGAVGLMTAFTAPLAAPAPPDPLQADVTITIQEAYFAHMLAQSSSAPWGNAFTLDIQPGNRLALAGRVSATIVGQTLEGDVSAVITLSADDGQLRAVIEQVNVSGLAISGMAETFVNELSERISLMINDQIQLGLGQGATILSVATDEKQLVIRARWP